MQALVYRGDGGPTLENVPIPQASPGTAVIKVLAALLSPNARKVYSGAWGPLLPPPPFTPSCPAIARIHQVGDDATALVPGQLVIADFHITGRDSHASTLQGYIHFSSPANDKLATAHKDGTLAEYARLPLENVLPLNEDLLFNKLKYDAGDLAQIMDCVIGHAGLMDACELKAGDTVIVAPSTGRFGGCVVQIALAMGARVIAAGRTPASLDKIAERYAETGRVTTAVLVGDEAKDTKSLLEAIGGEGADAFVDMSPTGAKITHLGPCIQALRHGGRAALIGGDVGMVPIPYVTVMVKNIRIQGSHMSTNDHLRQTIKLVESGLLKVGSRAEGGMRVQRFKLSELEAAYEANEKHPGFGNIVVMEP